MPLALLGRHTGALCVVVLGPGYGESTLVRVPHAGWLVVDGCEHGDRSYPLAVLEEDPLPCLAIVLTHPHADHALGLEPVIDRAPWNCLVGCLEPLLLPGSPWIPGDPVHETQRGAGEHVLARILDRWTRFPGSRWPLVAGSRQQIDDCEIVVLHPPEPLPAPAALRKTTANQHSNPLLVTWGETRIVLGADLPRPCWATAAMQEAGRDLGRHHLLKVPHHGSEGAMDPAWTGGTRERSWIVTPWSRGRSLPRFEDEEGIHRMLSSVVRLDLTRLAFVHDREDEAPLETTREDIRDRRRVTSTLFPGFDGERVDVPADFAMKYWIAAAYDRAGRLLSIEHGPGSVVVRESGDAADEARRGA